MTNTTVDKSTLLNELDVLLRLTRTEAQIARIRSAQARRDDIRDELRSNAREADTRAARLQAAVRALGGTPDVFADAVGRVTAVTKATIEQGQPFYEGLLGDLALEHELRDRAVFSRVLAEALNERQLVDALRSIEDAHTETIEWITVRLAEIAQGGPAALSPTAVQSAVNTMTRIALAPSRRSANLMNKAVDLVQGGRKKAEKALGRSVDKAEETAKATREVVAAGRNAALARTEEVAPSADVRKAARQTRKELGSVEASELPVKNYDDLSSAEVTKQLEALEDADDVKVVLRYEQANKDRKGVATAAEKRLSELAENTVSA